MIRTRPRTRRSSSRSSTRSSRRCSICGRPSARPSSRWATGTSRPRSRTRPTSPARSSRSVATPRCRSRRGGSWPLREAGRLEIWGTTKVPHFNRRVLASMLGIPVEQIRLHTADAGGGFGVRGEFYPEDYLVPWLALRTDRPVKWIEDRSEHLVATNHSRHQIHAIEAAFDDRHRLLAIADEVWHDTGAYIRTHGGGRRPHAQHAARSVPRARVPRHRARGAHRPNPLRDLPRPGSVRGDLRPRTAPRSGRRRARARSARHPAAEPAVARRAPAGSRVSAIGTTMTIDAGDVGGLLERTIAEAGVRGLARRVGPAAGRRMVGTGAAVFMEKSGPPSTPGWTCCRRARSGSRRGPPARPGRRDRLATLAAERLGLDVEDITVVLGDTDLVPEASDRGRAVRPSCRERGRPRRRSCRRARPGGGGRGARGGPRRSPDVGWSVRGRGSPERAVSLAELAGRSGGFSARRPSRSTG